MKYSIIAALLSFEERFNLEFAYLDQVNRENINSLVLRVNSYIWSDSET